MSTRAPIFILMASMALSGCSTLFELTRNQKQSIYGSWRFADHHLGPLVLSFRENNTFEVDFNDDGKKDIWGKFQRWSNRIIFRDNLAGIITDCYEPGIHTYTIKNNILRHCVNGGDIGYWLFLFSNTKSRIPDSGG